MGTYTRLRGEVVVKPEYVSLITNLCDPQKTPNGWSDLVFDHPWLNMYSQYREASWIPRGSYADEDPSYTIDAAGLWKFSCMLKDYGGVISVFFDEVISRIALDCTLYCDYESASTPAVFHLIHGIVVQVKSPQWDY